MRWVIPNWLFRGFFVFFFFAVVLFGIMTIDYWYVMNQIEENKQIKLENRRLRQQVQIFQNKMASIEDTLERVQTFSTRLKIITNVEDKESLVQRLDQELPYAAANIGKRTESREETAFLQDPETMRLQEDQQRLDEGFQKLQGEALTIEQELQDLYELLFDQKSFLSALPTRKPALGYFTSGFGVRKSPYGGVDKMHEGLDIANHPGTTIVSTADGEVSFAGKKPGYGRTVVVDHGYGLETWYGHTWRILVKPGEKIRRGTEIAKMGSSGRSTGPHVHYEVRIHGIPVDPLSYILEE